MRQRPGDWCELALAAREFGVGARGQGLDAELGEGPFYRLQVDGGGCRFRIAGSGSQKKGSSRNLGEVVVDGSEVGRLAVAKQTDPLPLPRHARCYVGRGLLGRPRRRFISGA
ncbi:hypothetical protein, partial [Azoarcus indigens]|uniref:hypothetical protein n=1 Tax=Azoarcus indigens TaxID=29545 RepID=UPI001B86A33A